MWSLLLIISLSFFHTVHKKFFLHTKYLPVLFLYLNTETCSRIMILQNHTRLHQNTRIPLSSYTLPSLPSISDCTVKCHNGCNGPVNLLCGFFLIHFDVSRWVLTDKHIIHHPTQHLMSAMCDPLLQCQLSSVLLSVDKYHITFK